MAQTLRERLPASQILIAPRRVNPLFKEYRVVGTPAYCLLDAQHIVRATGLSRFDATTLMATLEHTPLGLSQEGTNA